MKKSIFPFLLAILAIHSFAQAPKSKSAAPAKKAPVQPAPAAKPNSWIFTYGSDTVFQQEFERLLSKNRKEKQTPTQDEINEYLELYQNFKMMVKEAQLVQLDTFTAFKNELAGYRKQLANPYLTDKKVTDQLIQEAYNRTKEEINASHILINCAENASPKDTLAAFNKINDLRKRILKGERFDSLAARFSEDPSASKNLGNLGWFTAFYMIYPFENMAYATPIGQVSLPFRTKYGYHIIKTNNKRVARGEVKVAHIMLQIPQNADEVVTADTKTMIDGIYNRLVNGESFDSLAKEYSSDMSSKNNGGIMNFMASLSNYPEVFKDVAFTTPKGQLSQPFRTDYGWHIVKTLEIKPVPELSEVQESLKNKITRDSRSESNRLAVAARIKRETKYKEYPQVLKEFSATLDSTFLDGNWEPNMKDGSEKTILSFNDRNFDTRDFANYVRAQQEPHKGESVDMVIRNLYKNYTNEKAIEYEESILEIKHEDFKYLMQEYHDGIMLFDLKDKKVWSKSVSDTVGLEAFHKQNASKYMWKERLKVYTLLCLDEKTELAAMKMAKAGKSNTEIVAKLNKKIKGAVTIDSAKYEKGANPAFDKLWDTKGVVDLANENNTYRFHIVFGVVAAEPKSLKEARGPATSDYQNYLEKEWIQELRNKYPVTVNSPALGNLFK
jgi:peptidyl-prolyl cis-trans isomerase SurA